MRYVHISPFAILAAVMTHLFNKQPPGLVTIPSQIGDRRPSPVNPIVSYRTLGMNRHFPPLLPQQKD